MACRRRFRRFKSLGVAWNASWKPRRSAKWCPHAAAAVLMVCQHSERVPSLPPLPLACRAFPACQTASSAFERALGSSHGRLVHLTQCLSRRPHPTIPYPVPLGGKRCPKVCGPPSPPVPPCMLHPRPARSREAARLAGQQWLPPLLPFPTCMHHPHRAKPLAQKCFNRARLMAPSLPGT